ncbi:hypothetical protein N0V86_000429 [Didymella sp. IMI 355093]|nr:hypothetical protein N0V86_000429 [Didymella sp. IMI 355093]
MLLELIAHHGRCTQFLLTIVSLPTSTVHPSLRQLDDSRMTPPPIAEPDPSTRQTMSAPGTPSAF